MAETTLKYATPEDLAALRSEFNKEIFNIQGIVLDHEERLVNLERPTPISIPPSTPGTLINSWDFASLPIPDWGIQAKSPSRVSLVPQGVDGNHAVRLQTLVGDSNITGSGSGERCDLTLSQSKTGGYEGKAQVWQHSILLPTEFRTGEWHVAMDFHCTGAAAQANMHIDVCRDGVPGIYLRGYAGNNPTNQAASATFFKKVDNIRLEEWYNFEHRVYWTSGLAGYFITYLNGIKVLDYIGPTLYNGQGVYLKLANYHSPFNQPTAIIHDKVKRYDI